MPIAEAARRPRKSDRIRAHIAELKGAILSKYPSARIEEAPVPESRWPGLWVRCDADLISDVTEPLSVLREEFFLRERMDVHVIVLDKSETPGGNPD